MKKPILLFFYIFSVFSFSQIEDSNYSKMIEAEMKAAAGIQNFKANPNTQNYDITYHELRFEINPAVYFISGKVTTIFTALEDMNTVTFDLANELTVSSVMVNEAPSNYVQNGNNEIVITLPTTLMKGSSQFVSIAYGGAPPRNGFNSFVTSQHNGTPVLWTLSEPYGARDWWPCKQDLNDKINSIDVYITTPAENVSVSNGLQQGTPIDNGNGTITTHFHHSYPIAAYLIAIAATNYTIYTQQGGLGTVASPYFPIVNYMYPETANTNQVSVAVTPAIINFFESILGIYPFRNEKYGHCQFSWGGGMEHTTVSFMTADGSGAYDRELISHEMGHQWFGNKVTCGSWNNIWLNEGITEYMSGLVIESFDGAESFVNWKASKSNSITSQPRGNLYLTDTQIQNVNTIFNSRITYNKGSMVTNMIRYVMGDTNFFQALQNYLNDPALAYNYAVTEDFKSHLEAASGIDFTEFFNDWVYNEGYPSYTITVQNWGAGQAKITVNQTQSHPSVSYFEMPLVIRLLGAGGQTHNATVNNTTNGEEFIVNVPFEVTGVEFDPNKDIISKNNVVTLSAISVEEETTIALYPNPSNGDIHINMPSNVKLNSVQFFNTLGQLVLTKNKTDFSTLTLASGVYVVLINTSKGKIYKNFIKK